MEATPVLTKVCGHCHTQKPASEFGRDRGRPDGLFSYCRDCARAAARRHHETPHGRAKHRKDRSAWIKTAKGKASVARTYRRWRQSEKGQRYAQKRAAKAHARSAVSNAVRDGRLPPAKTLTCRRCGLQASEYRHHQGYEPENHLSVIPLCTACHKAAR